MSKPNNAAKHPIGKLIEELQALPPDTTFDYVENDGSEFYGGQTISSAGKKLGTSYMLKVDIVEGCIDQ